MKIIKELSEKIDQYLHRNISREDLSDWAFEKIASDGFQVSKKKNDPFNEILFFISDDNTNDTYYKQILSVLDRNIDAGLTDSELRMKFSIALDRDEVIKRSSAYLAGKMNKGQFVLSVKGLRNYPNKLKDLLIKSATKDDTETIRKHLENLK